MAGELSTTLTEPNPILDSYEAYGCKVNAINPVELVQRYQQGGFLYSAKLQRLKPFLPTIISNWRRGMRGDESILNTVTFLGSSGAWASVSAWRSTHTGWNCQHLVSTGGPVASRAVLLAEQAAKIRDGTVCAGQSWFQPGNRYANRLFGSIEAPLGSENASVAQFNYLTAPLTVPPVTADGIAIVPCRVGTESGLFDFAVGTRGRVYAVAEELDHEDLLLDAVDRLYGTVGLRRYRRVWLATMAGYDGPVGAAIAYRGPLGFNFSFLENRCDLLVEPTLTNKQTSMVAQALIAAAASAYQDFPLRAIPLVVDDHVAQGLLGLGTQPIRRYAQSIWLRTGFVAWYRHVEQLYQQRLGRECVDGALSSDARRERVPQRSADWTTVARAVTEPAGDQ